jgi:hypothetical protein
MSTSLDTIFKKMASLETNGGGTAHEIKFDPARHISPTVAHELNNILTIIQGYADRLLVKNSGNPALESHLKLICEASRRASILVRSAVPTHIGVPPYGAEPDSPQPEHTAERAPLH